MAGCVLLSLSACSSGLNATGGWGGEPISESSSNGRSVDTRPAEVRIAELTETLPRIEREFRAAWVATVDNIDWPSEPGLPVFQQQAEMLEILDRAKAIKLNAIVFQVRPTADAMFISDLEPWSYYLTGNNGLAHDPVWDPLAFTIDEAHRRGIELHAWVNPYRAWHPTAPDTLSQRHVSNQYPDAVHRYGAQRWMDPGASITEEHSFAVIMDIVDRYDVDGIHMDDYFYPYGVNDEQGNKVDFPDSLSWAAYDGPLALEDWRRSNVDHFIERVYSGIKERKPWVLFGISPFGIWRPGHPEGVTGFDAYEGLFADAKKWLEQGWVDYWTPQLYWPLESKGQPFGPLLDWWVGENRTNRHMWPGMGVYRVDPSGSNAWQVGEVVDQIRRTRTTTGASGNVLFSWRSLRLGDPVVGDTLVTDVYEKPALTPRTTWLGSRAPSAPTITLDSLAGRPQVRLRPGDDVEVRVWEVHRFMDGVWQSEVLPGTQRLLPAAWIGQADAIVLRAVNRLGLESEPSFVLLP